MSRGMTTKGASLTAAASSSASAWLTESTPSTPSSSGSSYPSLSTFSSCSNSASSPDESDPMSEMSPKISVASMILLKDLEEFMHLYVSSANMHPSNFVRHHIESFDDMLWNEFPAMVAREKPVSVKGYRVKFGTVRYEPPCPDGKPWEKLTPAMARRTDATYHSAAVCDLTVTDPKGLETVYPRLELCKIPVMVGSAVCWTRTEGSPLPGECPSDPGGYFIIKGKERVVVPHIRPAYDQPCVYKNCDGWLCEFRSVNRETRQTVLVQAKTDCRRKLEFSLPYIKQYVPVGLVFKALGKTAREAVAMCGLGSFSGDEVSCRTVHHQSMAALLMEQHASAPEDPVADLAKHVPDGRSVYLKQAEGAKQAENADRASVEEDRNSKGSKEDYVKHVLAGEIFLHGGDAAEHLGWMVKRMADAASGIGTCTDRDDLANKRVDATGPLIAFLLDGLLKQYVKLFVKSAGCQKNLCPYTVLQNSMVMTNSLHMCFATGNWTVKRLGPPSYVRVGVSQVLSNNNYGARVSHLRRIMHAVSFRGKNIRMRQLHSSHYGFLCPYETPEGEKVGIVLNMAEGVGFSLETPREAVLATVRLGKGLPGFFEGAPARLAWSGAAGSASVDVDGVLCGVTGDPVGFVREARLCLLGVSVVWKKVEREIHLLGCQGRFVRRVLDPEGIRGSGYDSPPPPEERDIEMDPAPSSSPSDFLSRPPGVYVCAQELSVCSLGDGEYADPPASEILTDAMSSVIPFYDHTQSPRNAYQSNMGKQAIGFPAVNCSDRYDATLHRLDYPQKSLVDSRSVKRLGFDEMAHGALPVVAIMTAGGFNQEDSVVLNASSLDRGLFSCVTYRTVSCADKRRTKYDSEVVCLPDWGLRNREWDYDLLGDDGVIDPLCAGALVRRVEGKRKAAKRSVDQRTGGGPAGLCDALWIPAGTVLVGKVSHSLGPEGNPVRRDASLTVKQSEEGYLDRVTVDVDSDGKKLVKVRLRTPRHPEMGDKFASFTAQKGTCGAVLTQEDMPFDKNGVVPDLIINPHAFPSRMTVNYLLQMCFGTAACKLGKTYDATAFEREDVVRDIAEAAKEAGIDCWDSVLYSGSTGRRLPTKIFMAPCPYQRLRHMVSGKMHSRTHGPTDALTRQPVAGRSREGGIKIGEMEQWCKISHGVSESLKESVYDTSDKYEVPVCKECGRISDHFEYCRMCDATDVSLVKLPYTTKILFQELRSIGISIAFK
ncbi:DNA-dependent RNA polymerase II second largest subunit domain 6,7,3,2 beta subunit [Ranavirus ambystoma1]|uniref:DNA-directed RNA polymerase subunit beta n=1 Tax=Ranavirus ambystoma1 TaxID=265294 RepID=A0A0U2QJG7_9VIRU|nr:DNA-dependent RNA polymerase II second largest subunit domain 6,7,3,2 beta subunit [Ambystoma tigrinum virus]